MKMSDVFELPLSTMGQRLRKWTSNDGVCGYHIGSMTTDEWAEAAAHAINCHDELVAALQAAIECGMVPKSSARDGGANQYSRQARVADQIRDALAKCQHSTGELVSIPDELVPGQ